MSTYCRITGRSRGLPKPHYFPLLPPISPADARRICRITGKSYGLPTHHFIPVLSAVSRARAKPCHITSKSEGHESHHYAPASVKHVVQKGFRYLAPLLEANAELMTLLEGKPPDEHDHHFIYTVDENKCTLVLPTRIESAIRDGDIKDIMLSKDNDKILVKLRKGATIELSVQDYCADKGELFEGEGPSKEAILKRKKRKPNDSTDWRRKMFEDKEKQALSEEMRLSEIKSKRIKVKLEAWKEHPVFGSWKNVHAEPSSAQTDDRFHHLFKPILQRLEGSPDLSGVVNATGKPFVNTLPQPTKIESQIVDLSLSLPGIIQQPIVVGDSVTGFPVAKTVSPFQPFVQEIEPAMVSALQNLNANKSSLHNMLQKQNVIQQKQAASLPSLENVPDLVKSLRKLFEKATKNGKNSKNEHGLRIMVGGVEKFVPGQFVKTDKGETFVPGNVVETSTGPTFVPGLVLHTDGGTKFLPGFIFDDEDHTPVFVAGQNALTRHGERFVQGQVLQTSDGARFMPGQTIVTSDGVRFVPGQIIDDEKCKDGHRFVSGQIVMTPEGPQFVTGYFSQNPTTGEVSFVAGQSILNENCNWEFVPGQNMKTEDGAYVFVAGKEVVDEEGRSHFVPGQVVLGEDDVERFVPGITVNDDSGNVHFVPGMEVETDSGSKFVEGIIATAGDGSLAFAAGKVIKNADDTIEFISANGVDDLIFHDAHSGVTLNPASDAGDEVFGHLVQSAQGVEFFPGDAAGLPAGKKIPGRLVKGKEMRFIPGTMIDGKFVPGQIVTTDTEEKFIPGQVIETNEGPKFVPGQVLQTRTGPKFVPGQTMETENGPKFIPGQIIETKRGPTFIPGQVIFTDEEGSRFVPGQVVDTVEGPRFVPGRVVETGDHVTFIPGQIVETEEGLKFIAPDLEDDPEGGYQFTVQGFEVAPEEVKMIGNSIPHACFIGEMAIDAKTLQQLAEAGMAVGRQLPVDIPSVNIRSLPVTEAACRIAHNLDIDASQSVKMSHILSALQQVKQAGVALTPEEIGGDGLEALVYLALESEHDKESYEFLQTLGDALEDTIRMDENKIEGINALHKLSTNLAGKVREKLALINSVANQLGVKLHLNSAYVQGKVGQILSNLEQIKKSEVFIPRKDVKDKNLKMLLNLVSDCDAKLAQPDLLKTLASALENTVQVDPNRSLETIETLCDLTDDLASRARAKALPSIGIAHAVTRNLDLDPANAVKVNHILANIQAIKNSNAAFAREELDDENLQILLDLVQLPDGSNEDEVAQAIASAFENTVKLNLGHKLDAIDKLHKLTANVANKANKKSVLVTNAVKDMAKKFKVNDENAPKLDKIVANLIKMKHSDEIGTAGEISNSDGMKALIALVRDNKNLNDEEFLEVLKNELGNIADLQNIDLLQASTVEVVSQAERKTKLKSESALSMAGEFEMSPEYSVKMMDILSNLNKIKKAGVAIDSKELNNDNLLVLLNLAAGSVGNEGDAISVEALSKALKNTLKIDPEQKSQIVDQLHMLTADLANEAQSKATIVNEIASNIATKVNVDEPQSAKIAQILSNLEQIKLSNLNLESNLTEDENLKVLLQAVKTNMNEPSPVQFLQAASATLEGILSGDPGSTADIINHLEALTHTLAYKSQDESKKVTESACMIAENLNVSTPQLIKIGRILSNLKQIKESNALIPDETVGNENVELLLSLAMACDEKPDDPQALEAFTKVLEKTLKLDEVNKNDTIAVLDKLTADLASEAVATSALMKQSANTIANNLNVDEAQSVQLSHILSNLQQIGLSNIDLEEGDTGDKEVQALLSIAKHCKKGGAKNKKCLKAMEASLEELIKRDPEHVLDTIAKLQKKSADLISNVKEKSKVITATACEMADNLNLSTPHLVQLNHILSDLQAIQKSGIPILNDTIKNENLELALSLASACNAAKSDEERMKILADVLENTIQIQPDQKIDTIEILHSSIAEMKKAAKAKSKCIQQAVAQIAKKFNLEPQSAKLNQIFANALRIQSSNLDTPENSAIDENVKEFLDTIKKSKIPQSDDVKFSKMIASAMEKYIQKDLENKSSNIDALHSVTTDLDHKIQSQSLLTAETALSLANVMNLDSPQAVQMNHILSNLQQVKQNNFMIPENGTSSANLKMLLSLALRSDQETCNPDVIKALGNALQKTVTNVDSTSTKDAIAELHDLMPSLAAKAQAKMNAFDKTASKIAAKLQVDRPYATKLCQILANLQEMQISKIDIPTLKIKDQTLKMLIQTALKTEFGKNDEAKFLQVVGDELEESLKKDLDHKLENIDLLYAFTCEVVSSKRQQAVLTAETAFNVSKKLGLGNPQAVQVNHILSNIQQIQKADLSLTPCESENAENVKLLLDLSAACQTNSTSDSMNILADALQKTMALDPRDKGNIVAELDKLTSEVAKKTQGKLVAKKTIAEAVQKHLNLDEAQSIQMEEILSNLQQIKLSNICASKETIENEDIGQILKQCLQCDIEKGDIPFLQAVGSLLQAGITPQHLQELHKVTKELASKARDCTLQTAQTAYCLANDLNVETPQLVKIGQILSNLLKIKHENVALPDAKLSNDSLEILLNLTLAGESTTSPQVIESLAAALQKTLSTNPGNCIATIDDLNQLTKDAAKLAEKKTRILENLADQVVDEINVDKIHSAVVGDIISNLQQIKLGHIDRADIEKIEDKAAQKLIKEALQFNISDGDQTHLKNIAQVLESITTLAPETKLHILGTLHNVTKKLVADNHEKLKLTTEMAMNVSNDLNLTGTQPIVQVSHILSSLQQVKQSNFLVPNGGGKQDENVELLVNLALSCNDPEVSNPAVKFAEALQKTLHLNPEGIMNTLKTLSNSTTEVARKACAESELINQAGSQLTKDLKLSEPYSAKLSQTLSNLQRLKLSQLPMDLIEAVEDAALRGLLQSTMGPSVATSDFRAAATEALKNILEMSPENKLIMVNTLHALTNDLVSAVNKTALTTTEMAYDIADEISAGAPQIMKMKHILSNLQQLKQVDFMPESHCGDESLELLMNLALSSNNEKEEAVVLKNLANALKKTAKTENTDANIDKIHQLTTELTLQATEKSKILDATVAKIAENCNLDEAETRKIKEILMDAQRVKLSKIDPTNENVGSESLKALLTDIINSSPETATNKDSIQEVGKVLEEFLLSDADHKGQNIASLQAAVNNIASKARDKSLLMAETAYTVGQELNMNTPQLVKISHILSNLCDIKQSHTSTPMKAIGDDNLELLLTLALPCDATKPIDQTLETLVSVLKNTLNLDPEQKGKIVDNLQTLTADLAQSAKTKSKLIEKKAKEMAQKLNVGEAYSTKLCEILSNLQQIKTSNIDTAQQNIKNENWKTLINSVLHIQDNLEDAEFYDSLGSAVEKMIRVDPEHKLQNINSLHAVLNGIITKENNKTYLIASTAYNMATDLNVKTPDLMKITHILSDLQELNQADVAIPQDDIKNNEMRVLLNLALAGDGKKSDVEIIESLSKALLSTIQADGQESGSIIETLHSHTADISSKAQEKLVHIEKVAQNLATKLGLDASKAAKLTPILCNLEQLAISSLDVDKLNIKSEEIKKLVKLAAREGDQTNLESLALMVENFLKQDLEHQSYNLDELHGCVSTLSANEKNKAMLLTENALQVASHLNLGIDGTMKMAKILSNVQQIKEAGVSLSSIKIEDNNLKLLLDLTQEDGNQTGDLNYEKLGKVLENTLKMDMNHSEQIVEKLFALTADAANDVAQKAVVFKDYGLELAQSLDVDQEMAIKLIDLLSNLQLIAQSSFNIGQSTDNEGLNMLLELSKECANEQDEVFVKIIGNTLEKALRANLDNRVYNINTLYEMVSEMANTLKHNTIQAASTSQAVASNLKLDASEAVQMSDVLLNLQHMCQINVPLATQGIQNEDVKLIIDLALSSVTNSDNPAELVPTLGKALEKLMDLRPEIKSETINLLHSTTSNLAKEAEKVSSVINDVTAHLVERLKISQPSAQKIGSIFTNLLSIQQANSDIPQEFAQHEHLKKILGVMSKVKSDSESSTLIETIGNALEGILKLDVEHKDETINALQASVLDLATHIKNKSTSQTSIACQIATRLQINESCAVNIHEVLSDLKQLKQMQGVISNVDIEDKNLKLLFNHVLACEDDAEHPQLLRTLADAIEHTVKAEKDDGSDNINKLQSLTAQLVSVAQSRSALIEQTASKLAAKLKVSSSKLNKILSNLQQIRRSSVFASTDDISNKDVRALLNFALENDDLDDVKFFKAVSDMLEKTIKANMQQKSQTVDSLCAITTNLASGTWDRALTMAETSHNVANSVNAEASSINVSHILSNLQQIKLTNIAIPGDAVQDEDLKLLLDVALAYDGDADSSDFVQTLGLALKSAVNLNPEKAVETLAKFHTLTGDISTKVRDQSCAIKEVATKVANNLKVENSTISDIITNLKEIQLYNLASVESVENKDLKDLLNLASECGYDYEDVEFLQTLGDAIENIIEMDLDQKSQKIDTLHALSSKLALAGRQKALLITTMACKMVDKLNLDPSHSVTISRILTNLQEISESGFIVPSSEVKDRNLEVLLHQIAHTDANKEECAFLSELGQTLEKLIAADPKRKLETMSILQTLSSDIVRVIRERPPSKVQLLRSLIKNNLELQDDVVEKLSSILDTNEMAMCVAFRNMSRENPDFVGKVLRNAASILSNKRIDEKTAVETLHRAIVKAVGETSEHHVTQVLRRNEGEDFRSLVVDASGLAKALGMNEVVHVLDVILSDSRSMPMLAKDKIVMEVLKRLTVMRQLAEKQPTLRAALHDLQYDPYAARNDPRLRALVRDSAVLMVIPEESLVLRSSADIPCSLLFGDNTLAVEDFMVKSRQTGKTFLILKRGVQMVVPREAARDVLTGKVPYTVLDENGIHHFTPLHVFNALKLPRIATNWFSNYGYTPKMSQKSKEKGEASEKELLFSRGGSVSAADDPHKTFPNGSCSTQQVMKERWLFD